MSAVSRINNIIIEIKNKMHFKSVQPKLSYKNTMVQTFTKNDIQPQDFYEIGLEATDNINSQIEENLFEEEKNSNTKLNFIA